ncbi:MAG TPA: hypothetical protein PKA20_30280 [Burkholderiaceae bacterium]|nr:hypothetical protein [Burkholderiaceae bacterium]
MSADFEPPGSAPPRNGDFARYLDDLVNRGYPAPGTVRDAATFDAGRLLRRLAGRQQPPDGSREPATTGSGMGSGGPYRGIPQGAQPGGDAQWGTAAAASKYRGIPSDRSAQAGGPAGARPAGHVEPGQPRGQADRSPAPLPDLPVLAARPARSLARLASKVLLVVSVIWLALGLIADVQFFVNTIPIAMGLLFLSLYLRPGKPKPPPRT